MEGKNIYNERKERNLEKIRGRRKVEVRRMREEGVREGRVEQVSIHSLESLNFNFTPDQRAIRRTICLSLRLNPPQLT